MERETQRLPITEALSSRTKREVGDHLRILVGVNQACWAMCDYVQLKITSYDVCGH